MKYKSYRLSDFLNDDAFVHWALFKTDDVYWQQVGERYPVLKETMEQAREIICQLNAEEHRKTVLLNEEEVLSRIQKRIVASDIVPEKRSGIYRRWRLALPVAASLILVLTGWLVFRTPEDRSTGYRELVMQESEKTALTEKVNTSGKPMKITLEDGTVVVLAENARLSYPARFGASGMRETFLSGEAFFEVAQNPEKPFLVYANELVTKVLGTSFEVHAPEDEKQVKVNVRSGQVSVYSRKQAGSARAEDKALVLLPNQQAVFDRKSRSLSKYLVEDPMMILPPSGHVRLRFDEVPVSVVLDELERAYGIRIIYNKETLSSCVISTMLGNESLMDKLDVVCQTISATHREIDAQIIIESTGCL